MAFSAEIRARLGLDVSDFKNSLASADSALRGWSASTTGSVGAVGRSVEGLRKLFLAGGILTAARAFFQGAIDHARKYEGEVDSSIEATKRLGNTFDSLKVKGAELGITVVGAVEKVAIGLASLVYGVDAATEAYDKLDEAARRALDEERARRLADAKTALAKIVRDIAFSEADALGKISLLTKEQVELKTQLRAIGAETVEGQKLLGELAVNEQQIRKATADLAKADTASAKEKAAAEKETNAELEKQKKLRDELVSKIKLETAATVAKHQAEANAIIEGADRAAASQGFDAVTPEEQQAVLDWVAGGRKGPAPISRSGKAVDALSSANLEETNWLVDGRWHRGAARPASDFENVSVGALEEFIRRRERDKKGITENFGTGPTALVDAVSGGLVRNSAAGVIAQEIRLALAQLERRRQFDGVDRGRALAGFAGDPLSFDRLYEAAQSQRDETRVQTDVLRSLQEGQRRGFQALAEGLKAQPRS
jgi:hypothetical protein